VNSIRRNLLLALLAAMSAVTLAAAYATYRMAEAQANALFDEQLRQVGLSMRQPLFAAPGIDMGGGDDSDYVIQVWSTEGETVYYSRSRRVLPDRALLGLATIDTPSGAWRVFGLQRGGQTIQVAQPMAVRSQRAATAALATLVPFIVSLPVLGGMIWYIVGRGLRPLERVARAVRARTAQSLAPLDPGDAPQEIGSLVVALNALLARLQEALERQRDFIADAAHELRTPLAALQLQVQVAARAVDGEERAAAMGEVMAGLQRASHAVQQLLTLARNEAADGETTAVAVDLAAVARDAVVEHQPLAAAKNIDLGLDSSGSSEEPAPVVQGDAEGIRILLANLVGNALRYTPAGGRVDVAAGVRSGRPCLVVEDNGPGIPPAERERVFARFYRGTHKEAGSGLGLAIVRAIAQRHGAEVSLESADGGGLRAVVSFPAATAEGLTTGAAAAPGRSGAVPQAATALSRF
jgi:two-component system OmpR family sensor kinase